MRSILRFPIFSLIALLTTPSVRAQQQHDTLVLHFAFAHFTLRPDDAGRLAQFIHASVAKTDSLFIIGYTDTVGTSEYNHRLSLSRALVTAHFIQHLSSVPLNISAKGEEEPVAGDDSMSRRVLVIARDPSPVRKPAPLTSSHPPSGAAPAPDTVISLANINFIEDSPNLTAASRMVLPAYIRSLQRYRTDFMEVDGYCNSTRPITNTSDPLFKLSVQRAKLIFDYLLDAGFDSTKLTYKGLGNASPKNSHPATSDEARSNMRVEILIFHKAKSTVMAQPDTLSSGVYPITSKPSGSTTDLAMFRAHSSTLAPGQTNHPPHALNDVEELIFIKEGSLKVSINDTSKLLGPGGIVLIMAGDTQSFQNTSDKPATYYVLTFKSKSPPDLQRGRQQGGSMMIDWTALTVKKTEKGESRPVFDRPTSMFAKLEVHATTLNSGIESHPPHTHRAEEIMLLMKGDATLHIGEKDHPATTGDIMLLTPNIIHNVKNTGTEQCWYFAIKWSDL